MNASEADKSNSSNEELIERQQLEGTPFWIIKMENEYNLIFGKYKITQTPFKDKKTLTQWLNKNQWNIITQLAMIIANDILIERNKALKQ